MENSSSDRDILYGILALQMGFVDRGTLVTALRAWSSDRSVSIADRLRQAGHLGERAYRALAQAVDAHLEQNPPPALNLAEAFESPGLAAYVVENLGDQDLEEYLSDRLSIGQGGGAEPALWSGDAASRYLVMHLHDDGGIGDVFAAFDREVGRTVALKRLKGSHLSAREMEARFLAEAQITGNLEHPGIVPVYGLGKDTHGRPFFAMRFIRGRNLEEEALDFHRRKASLAPDERSLAFRRLLRQFIDLCETTGYAHHRGVVHRDIKPRNVMVGKFGETLLVDWGLAKLVGARPGKSTPSDGFVEAHARDCIEGTQPGTKAGTLEYMSPEQARGAVDEIGPRSDVYGLGATLYFLLTGRGPFDGFRDGSDLSESEARDRALERVIYGDYPRPRTIALDVPPGLEAICLQAMSVEPAGRYASAAELGEAIERWLAEEPVAAHRLEVEKYRALSAEQPQVPEYTENLGRALNQLGLIYSGMGRGAEAEAALKGAVAAYFSLWSRCPGQPKLRADTAYCLTGLARFYASVGRLEEAERARARARLVYRRLVKARPQTPAFRTEMETALFVRSMDEDEEPASMDRDAPEPGGGDVPRGPGLSDLVSPESVESPPRAGVSPEDVSGMAFGYGKGPPSGSLPSQPATPPGGFDFDVDGEVFIAENRYEIVRSLARGGMGAVFVARDALLGREVAIKVAFPAVHADDSYGARLLREAHVLSLLDHPGIVPVYAYGRVGQAHVPAIVMRLIEGETMHSVLELYHQSGRTVACLRILLSAFIDACRAVAFANAAGVIHRDPKPSNIIIDPRGRGIVTDWGTCKIVGESTLARRGAPAPSLSVHRTEEGAIFGTPAFMSPEQASGALGSIDARTDVYVLGATLFTILTGRAPWVGQGDSTAILQAMAQSHPPSPRRVLPSVPRRLDAICRKSMSKSKEDRYPTAEILGDEVERWLGAQPHSPYPRRLLEVPCMRVLAWLRGTDGRKA